MLPIEVVARNLEEQLARARDGVAFLVEELAHAEEAREVMNSSDAPVRPERLMRDLNRILTPDTIMVSDASIPRMEDLDPPPSGLMFNYVDIADGCRVKQFSGRDWMRLWHQKKTLVLHGNAECAKSPTAKLYAATVAQLYPPSGEQFFCMVSAADVLPRDEMKTGTPIVLDELMPMEARGCNPPHSITDLKILTDVEGGGTIQGRSTHSSSVTASRAARGCVGAQASTTLSCSKSVNR